MALAATLGFHLLTFGLFFGEGGSGLLAWSASIALMTTLLIGGCLRWERRALRAQELACDRFAAQLVGPRTMVSTLRHVDGLMGGSGGQPGLIRALMGSSHPSTRSRVMNIARHRRMLGARP